MGKAKTSPERKREQCSALSVNITQRENKLSGKETDHQAAQITEIVFLVPQN